MIRIKTLSIPLVSALIAGSTLPALAQVEFSLSSDITYRQKKKDLNFWGGVFDVDLYDGSASIIRGCSFFQYYDPGFFINYCSPGTTGLVSAGSINGIEENLPYVLVTGIYPALAVAPREQDKIVLNAAPASTLPRPAGGFKDDSYSLFYNLTTTEVREYILTHYYKDTTYSKKQQNKYESDIVDGVYYYSFPSLADPERPAPISAVIYPMVEGRKEKNNTVAGFEFSRVNQNKFNKKGFVEMSYMRPNKFEWIGVTPSNIFAAVDKAYFSIKVMAQPNKFNSDLVGNYQGRPISVFPPYQNGGDPRVQLTTSYTDSFTTPPIFDSGTRGMVQVQYKRNFQTGGVTYDYSSRKFQIPVVVVDRYTEYEEVVFDSSTKKSDLLMDTDGDGYNNLNEWILDSDANEAGSIPEAPVPQAVVPDLDYYYYFFYPLQDAYFGFDVKKKLGTRPGVAYNLQVSRNNGKTWQKFKTNGNWSVTTVRRAPAGPFPTSVVIEVRSKISGNGQYYIDGTPVEPVQPPGTAGHIYRVKVTLKK
ncbi:MAG: hypothetical protein V4640_03765 [Verrucomicrobiota bacterium]